MKLLYVHGYNGDPYGNSYNNLKNTCGEKYELHTIDYNPTQPKEAVNMIHEYVSEHKIDVVIGASLGGFLTMNVFCVLECSRLMTRCLATNIWKYSENTSEAFT